MLVGAPKLVPPLVEQTMRGVTEPEPMAPHELTVPAGVKLRQTL